MKIIKKEVNRKDQERFVLWWEKHRRNPESELMTRQTAFNVFMAALRSTRRVSHRKKEEIEAREADRETVLYVLSVKGPMTTYQVQEYVPQFSVCTIANHCCVLEYQGLIERIGLTQRPYKKGGMTTVWQYKTFSVAVPEPQFNAYGEEEEYDDFVDPEQDAWLAKMEQQRSKKSIFVDR